MTRERPQVTVYRSRRLRTVFGDKGPNKYTFLFEGILDTSTNGREHEFTIDGRKMDVCIRGASPVPPWFCPSIPGVSEDRVEREWDDAWEFWGYASDETGGYGVRGIYSPRSRRGVYHLWKLAVSSDGCPACREDLHEHFAAKSNRTAMLALHRAMRHMSRGTAVGGFHIDCRPCWELYRQLRQSCELP